VRSPGKYVVLRVPIRRIGERNLERTYTLKGGLVEFKTRKVSPEE
jgi:hypothetical protein